MIDLYLHALTREALASDLAPFGLFMDGDLVAASHGHDLVDLSDTGDGVTVVLRCVDEALAVAILGGTFTGGTTIISRPENAPVPAGDDVVDLAAVAMAKTAEIRDGAEAVLAPYAVEYGAIEISSWPVQLREAEAFLSDPGASTPWLDAACAARGMDQGMFAGRIVANATAWSALQGSINGQRLAYQDRLDAILAGTAPDTDKAAAIRAIVVRYEMPGG